MQNITLGRILAFLLAVLLILCAWGLIFAPGGSGANIFIGLVLGFMAIYYATVYVGDFFDAVVFNGGSRERGELIREAKQFLREFNSHIKAQRSTNRKFQINDTEQFDNLSQAVATLKIEIGSSKTNTNQVNNLKAALAKARKVRAEFDAASKKLTWLQGARSFTSLLIVFLALRFLVAEPFLIPSPSMIPTLDIGDHLFVSKISYGIVNPFTKIHSYFYRWSSPKPGDVVVFQAPEYVGHHALDAWVKRVIAVAGQRVHVENEVVYVDGRPYVHVGPKTPTTFMNLIDYFGPPFWQQENVLLTKERIGDVVHDIYLPPSYQSPGEPWPKSLAGRQLPGLRCTGEECVVQEGHIFVMGDDRPHSGDGRMWGAVPVEMVKGKALFIWMSVNGAKPAISIGNFVLPSFRFSRWFKIIR